MARALPGALVEAVWRLGGGTSYTTHAARLRDTGPRIVVVRAASERSLAEDPACVADEFRLLRAVHETGVPVPEPIYLDAHGGRSDAMVVGFVEGSSILTVAEGQEVARALAAQLARIHRLPLDAEDFPALARRFESYARWLAHTPASPDDETREAEIRSRLRELNAPRRNRARVLHGDFWPGNVLFANGQISGVLDWEDATLADPALDVAITRLDLLWAYGEPTMREFTAAYAREGVADLADLPYWDLCAALRPAGALGAWAEAWKEQGRPDVTRAAMRERHRRFVDAALAAA